MHTLNEQVTVVPKATSDTTSTVLEQLISTIAMMTGWTRDGSNIYIDADHKYYLNITLSSTYAQIKTFFNSDIQLGSTTNLSLTNNNIVVRVHKSSSEKTIYLVIGDAAALTYVYTINANNEGVLFKGSSSSSGEYVIGANAYTNYVTTKAYDSGARRYAVAKFIDCYSSLGGVFSDLYFVYGFPMFTANATIVSFNGTVMRLVSIVHASPYVNFAFPVSDGSVPEEEDSENG
jgi:hypothetical protein